MLSILALKNLLPGLIANVFEVSTITASSRHFNRCTSVSGVRPREDCKPVYFLSTN